MTLSTPLFHIATFNLQIAPFTAFSALARHTKRNVIVIVQDPRALRSYLYSDGQNVYSRVVLVCTMNVYIPASLGRRLILRYQLLDVRKKKYSPYLQSED